MANPGSQVPKAKEENTVDDAGEMQIFGKNYKGTRRNIWAFCKEEGSVGLHTVDIGIAPRIFGSDEYEYYTYVERQDADALLRALSSNDSCIAAADNEGRSRILVLLKQRFGGSPTAATDFEKFAEAHALKWQRHVC